MAPGRGIVVNASLGYFPFKRFPDAVAITWVPVTSYILFESSVPSVLEIATGLTLFMKEIVYIPWF